MTEELYDTQPAIVLDILCSLMFNVNSNPAYIWSTGKGFINAQYDSGISANIE